MQKLLALITIAVFGSGCAAIVKGTHDDVTINSVPSGATFHVQPTGQSGVTPAQLSLSSKRKYLVAYNKKCHLPAQSQIDKQFSGWTVMNLFIPFGIIGFAIDFGTGAAYSLDDNTSTVLIPRENCN